jgi:superfamily II DNA or RNA helicase
MGMWQRTLINSGIYDEIVSARLNDRLKSLGPAFEIVRRELTKNEDISSPLATLLRAAIDLALTEQEKDPEKGIALATSILNTLHEHSPKVFTRPDELVLRSERLLAIVNRPSREAERPKGSLHTSSLLVNAEGDSLLENLRSEFDSADRIDLLCAFVKLSGFDKLRASLERHCVERGRPLRVLTTTYMGASELKAIERFAGLPKTEVKVSFDEDVTRLHAKAWIFHRRSGLSTAYVGSSNLSHSAQTEGLEWNVRLTESDQPALVSQMQETFEQYWADHDTFESYDPKNESHHNRLARALSPSIRTEHEDTFLPELEPKSFQKPILEELRAARTLDRHRNLLVAATGTGKTVMAALDYAALHHSGAIDSLLFVAHRREILDQARKVFRCALQRPGFGELFYDGESPSIGQHVFASIDSLDGVNNSLDLARYDMVILDEAHHTAAAMWQGLLKRVQPKELLGLTGTPERADGIDYDDHFPRPWIGNLRLWNAIPEALVPFRYYMLDVDGLDLRDVEWRAGRYAPDALAGKLIGAAEIFVQRTVRALSEHFARPKDLRAIAFCANVRHAEEVHRWLTKEGFAAELLTRYTAKGIRRSAKDDLNSGQIQVLCVVDIYNEGVDVPNVNALFFFRPTESATVFLQQLGRGLRRAKDKAELVVFDLTGRQHMKFRFDTRLRALLGHTPREVRELVKGGFGRLPSGCHLQFDPIAREEVLAQLQRAIPDDLKGLKALLGEPSHGSLSLQQFIQETDVDVASIYRKDGSWSGLRRIVGLDSRPLAGGEEEALQNVHKLLHVGDGRRLDVWEKLVARKALVGEAEGRIARMLFVVLYGKKISTDTRAERLWADHPILREELAALIPVLRLRNALLAESHIVASDIPLVLHGQYLLILA